MSRRNNILYHILLFPVVARPKALVCNGFFVQIAGSNLTVGMDICPQVQVSLIDKRSPTECGVSECDRETSEKRRPFPTSECRPMKKISIFQVNNSGTNLEISLYFRHLSFTLSRASH